MQHAQMTRPLGVETKSNYTEMVAYPPQSEYLVNYVCAVMVSISSSERLPLSD